MASEDTRQREAEAKAAAEEEEGEAFTSAPVDEFAAAFLHPFKQESSKKKQDAAKQIINTLSIVDPKKGAKFRYAQPQAHDQPALVARIVQACLHIPETLLPVFSPICKMFLHFGVDDKEVLNALGLDAVAGKTAMQLVEEAIKKATEAAIKAAGIEVKDGAGSGGSGVISGGGSGGSVGVGGDGTDIVVNSISDFIQVIVDSLEYKVRTGEVALVVRRRMVSYLGAMLRYETAGTALALRTASTVALDDDGAVFDISQADIFLGGGNTAAIVSTSRCCDLFKCSSKHRILGRAARIARGGDGGSDAVTHAGLEQLVSPGASDAASVAALVVASGSGIEACFNAEPEKKGKTKMRIQASRAKAFRAVLLEVRALGYDATKVKLFAADAGPVLVRLAGKSSERITASILQWCTACAVASGKRKEAMSMANGQADAAAKDGKKEEEKEKSEEAQGQADAAAKGGGAGSAAGAGAGEEEGEAAAINHTEFCKFLTEDLYPALHLVLDLIKLAGIVGGTGRAAESFHLADEGSAKLEQIRTTAAILRKKVTKT